MRAGRDCLLLRRSITQNNNNDQPMDGKLIPQKIELNSPQNAIYCLSITRVISYYYYNAPSLCDDCLNIIRYFSRFRIFHAVTRLIKLLGTSGSLLCLPFRSEAMKSEFRFASGHTPLRFYFHELIEINSKFQRARTLTSSTLLYNSFVHTISTDLLRGQASGR